MIFLWFGIFVVSLFGLVLGADWLLKSAERLGKAAKLSPFLIGTIILGFGTSLPELVSSIFGSARGAPDIVVANVVGSNVANILLVLGAATAVGGTLALRKRLSAFDVSALFLGTILYIVMAINRIVSFWEAVVLCIAFAVYLIYTLWQQHKDNHHKDHPKAEFRARDVAKFIIGLAVLVAGARYVVDSTIQIADYFSIATGVISAVFIALGTSLPELAVSIRAIQKGNSETAFGNVFGSGIFNMFLVTGVPGLISQLPVDDQTHGIGLPALALVAALTLTVSFVRGLPRWAGALSVVGYAVFIALMFGLAF